MREGRGISLIERLKLGSELKSTLSISNKIIDHRRQSELLRFRKA